MKTTFRTTLAFLVAAISAVISYSVLIYLSIAIENGSTIGSPIGPMVFMLLPALALTLFIAAPIHALLVYLSIDKPVSYLIIGTLLTGIGLALLMDQPSWQHPQGFISGLIASLLFNKVRNPIHNQ